jgi:hypothetical protein
MLNSMGSFVLNKLLLCGKYSNGMSIKSHKKRSNEKKKREKKIG